MPPPKPVKILLMVAIVVVFAPDAFAQTWISAGAPTASSPRRSGESHAFGDAGLNAADRLNRYSVCFLYAYVFGFGAAPRFRIKVGWGGRPAGALTGRGGFPILQPWSDGSACSSTG